MLYTPQCVLYTPRRVLHAPRRVLYTPQEQHADISGSRASLTDCWTNYGRHRGAACRPWALHRACSYAAALRACGSLLNPEAWRAASRGCPRQVLGCGGRPHGRGAVTVEPQGAH